MLLLVDSPLQSWEDSIHFLIGSWLYTHLKLPFVQIELKLTTFAFQPTKCWDCKSTMPDSIAAHF